MSRRRVVRLSALRSVGVREGEARSRGPLVRERRGRGLIKGYHRR
jgi:hypothetical protein